jgi:hypothetical protein
MKCYKSEPKVKNRSKVISEARSIEAGIVILLSIDSANNILSQEQGQTDPTNSRLVNFFFCTEGGVLAMVEGKYAGGSSLTRPLCARCWLNSSEEECQGYPTLERHVETPVPLISIGFAKLVERFKYLWWNYILMDTYIT